MTKLYCTNLDLGGQSKVFKYFEWRRPPIENNIKILKWNNSATAYWIILKFYALSLDDQTIFFKSSKWRRPLMEDDLKNIENGISLYQLWLMSSKEEIWGKLRGNLECGSAQPSLLSFLLSCCYIVMLCCRKKTKVS